MLFCSDFLGDKSPINNRMAPYVQTCMQVSSIARVPDYRQLKISHPLILKNDILTLVWGYWIYTKGEGKTNMN